jgi:hypothetical protein
VVVDEDVDEPPAKMTHTGWLSARGKNGEGGGEGGLGGGGGGGDGHGMHSMLDV